MRHKWDKSQWKKEGHATCINCGTVKQKHFPVIFYFVPYDKFTFGHKSPDCEKVKERNKTT